MSTQFAWKPNWIDYRSSVANVDRREDRGETVELCRECGCEADREPVPHSPRCPAVIGATGHINGNGNGSGDGLALLERMDAGDPLASDGPEEEDEELDPDDGLEEAPALDDMGPDGVGVSSSPPLGGSPAGPVVPAPLVSEETPSHAGDRASTSADTEGSTMPDTNGRAARGAFQRDILGALIAGHTTPVGIGQALARPGKRVSTTLVQLVAKGFVAKVGYGAYAPTDEGRRMFESGQPLDSLRSGREPRAATQGPTPTPVAVSEPPATPDAEEPSRPENDPEPEPQPDPAPEPAALGVLDLLTLHDELSDGTLTVTRWKANEEGDQDETAERDLRGVVRRTIAQHTAEEIGRAILDKIDERGTA